ncbi:hypothetical protein AAZX31_08G090200 [Glycine max]|uniref:Uncharacterized protein n=2 Tax=Glycine max TaxID=3847 RepID=K7L5P9_SOYBN|nr:uncharacterized protein LOC100785535 [Glycine max]KAG4999709.1 hypothetical protein JHK87_020781 [Glycine soja]KAG5024982.1 hypothetical protein JHK86_020896 [Glycine max]KAG5136151.1 hypothetical protein JHK82_020882 [Glycine max]KAH1050372.1 hypothetical protein GYH30_020719 [Glycine max]KAH1236552.1 hypothetical protein GmHk_08G021736 [Glycine max]|eukprot:XP_003531129.2 uncharacterized protein LOC100785535 [Glycine max]
MFMGFSCGEDHFDEKESEFPLIDETSATQEQNSIIMEVHHHLQGVADKSTDFCPVEHPMEPPDEDRPVKCPMPESSVINDERMHEKRFAESSKKRVETTRVVVNGERTTTMDAEPPARGVRKRHHTLTHEGGDLVMTPLMRMPPLPPLPSQNITIFQVLQQLDKFES